MAATVQTTLAKATAALPVPANLPLPYFAVLPTYMVEWNSPFAAIFALRSRFSLLHVLQEGVEGMCQSDGCAKPATLVCPTCKKLGIAGSFFCSQECFRSSWDKQYVVSVSK